MSTTNGSDQLQWHLVVYARNNGDVWAQRVRALNPSAAQGYAQRCDPKYKKHMYTQEGLL